MFNLLKVVLLNFLLSIGYQGIDTDLHGTPAFLQGASVDPNHDKHIDKETEDKCIQTNISGKESFKKNHCSLFFWVN